MATFEIGNMWSIYDETDLFLVTANSFIKKNGDLVMGRGMALQLKNRFPGIEGILGNAIKTDYGHLGEYSILLSPRWPEYRIGLFQVKTNWMDDASIGIIDTSVSRLKQHLKRDKMKGIRVDLNFPGIGNGKLSYETVLPVVEKLPDNVHVWRKG